jgi:hypothetical protein
MGVTQYTLPQQVNNKSNQAGIIRHSYIISNWFHAKTLKTGRGRPDRVFLRLLVWPHLYHFFLLLIFCGVTRRSADISWKEDVVKGKRG